MMIHKITFTTFLFLSICLAGCEESIKNAGYVFDERDEIPNTIHPLPQKPDYSLNENWALMDNAESGKVDVFYIHPTMYYEGIDWVADLEDLELNKKVDLWPMRHQASAFEDVGRVFAPRYRQAHYRVFTFDKEECELCMDALKIAYGDVREAFLYWLKNLDEGKPIIIAGHSQGTLHAKWLLKEFFDGTELGERLVTSYLLGWGVYDGDFNDLEPCQNEGDVNCYCSWMTYAKGFTPNWLDDRITAGQDIPKCINPMSWNVTDEVNDREDHLGIMTEKYKLKYKGKLTARVHNGLLWLDAPHVIGGRMLHQDNWHVGDYNLFHVNIKDNVKVRVDNFMTQRSNL
tara:strand:- start:1598 stop:2632 length:1035 start_codon:yes stop_codon:yes gene_type:complete